MEYSLGLDISTKTVGITLMNLSGKLIDIDYISFPKTSKKNGLITLYKKIDFFMRHLEKYKSYVNNIKHIFIEEPLKNGPNINTTILLAKFNGMISQKLYEEYGVEPEHLTVHECRVLFFPEYLETRKVKDEIKIVLSFPTDAEKKKLVHNKVSWLEPHIIWGLNKYHLLREENYDMADSYCVCRAGLCVNGYINKLVS